MSSSILIDSSVAIKWVVPEEGTDLALALRLKFELYAPELIIPEIANILWKKYQRNELSKEETEMASELLAYSGIQYFSMNDLLVKATDLAIALRHPAYDCIYLAAAAAKNIPFVTADARLTRKLVEQRFTAVKCYDLGSAAAL